ncbi:nuclear transport factor 2 family protein [Aquimarina sp. MMG016]|uniref:nuclear transport factor 2 family protein n=1 Tax=Aquimarina sp. MMG016 TaxID=2822690 RepID=UPI001B3A363D|nr:nuclear transport factor 2 family protein [Aquimarina sp. MMG016]MBQ4822611.1 nuclear transport factor 2 family protein [Aquimarina sp. MMG016]
MKHFLILSLLLITASSINGQNSEYEAVKKTVNYYLEGGTNNDFETLKKAFHKTATMRYIREGYQDVNALEFFKKVMKPGPKQNRKTKVVNVDISGHAATARLEIEYPTFTFIDYMSLLKIDGEWKIVSKIFYKKAHETSSK